MKWIIKYNNDPNLRDEAFLERWEVTNGTITFKASKENEAEMLCNLLNLNQSQADIINAYEGKKSLFSCQGQAMDGYTALAEFLDIAKKVRELVEA